MRTLLAKLISLVFIVLFAFNDWLARKRGYACEHCGCIAIVGREITVKGRTYTVCETCLDRFLKGGIYGKRQKREASHNPNQPKKERHPGERG